MIDPLSNSLTVWPSSSVSVRAGIRPLGLISRNHGSYLLRISIVGFVSRPHAYLLSVLGDLDGSSLPKRSAWVTLEANESMLAYLILQAEFLEQNRDLDAVRRLRRVETDIGMLRHS